MHLFLPLATPGIEFLQVVILMLRKYLFVEDLQKAWSQPGVCLLGGNSHLQPILDRQTLSIRQCTEVSGRGHTFQHTYKYITRGSALPFWKFICPQAS